MQNAQAAFLHCFVPQHREHEGQFGYGFVYLAFSIWYIKQSILNAYMCMGVYMYAVTHVGANFSQRFALKNYLYRRSFSFLLFFFRGPGESAQGEEQLLSKHCAPLLEKCGSREEAEPGLQGLSDCLLEASCSTRRSCAFKMQFSVPICRKDGAEQLSTPAGLSWAWRSGVLGWAGLEPQHRNAARRTALRCESWQWSADKISSTVHHLVTYQPTL